MSQQLGNGQAYRIFPENYAYNIGTPGAKNRAVYMGSINMYAVLGILFVLGSLAMLWGAGQQGLAAWRLTQTGKETTARVTDRSSDSSDDSTSYYLDYVFYVADNPVTKRQSVSLELYNRYPVDSTVPIRYEPANPANVTLQERDSVAPTVALGVFGSVFLTIGIGFLWWLAGSDARQKRYHDSAKRLSGQITSARRETDSDGNTLIKISYVFLTPEQKRIESVATPPTTVWGGRDLPAIGTPIEVAYLTPSMYRVL